MSEASFPRARIVQGNLPGNLTRNPPGDMPRNMARNLLTVALLVAVVCVTSGCNPFRRSAAKAGELCKESVGYSNAQQNPQLKIPAGLESPDTRNALRIPELNTPEPPPRTRGQGCLDEPPPYVIAKPKEPEA
jgi:uncharacterized lipoprotein